MTPEPRDATVRNSGVKPRRPHKKARTGCANCRRRRVKCSEEKPQCRACFRRGVECQYPSLQARSLTSGPSPVSPDDGPSPNSTSTQQSSQRQQILPLSSLPSITFLDFHRPRSRSQDEPFASFRIQDMALLHHWTISTSLDIYKNSGLSATCQVAFPQIAFKHPFVMDALLGLTALHVAYLDRQARLRHIADAVHYHNEGLNGFNDAMRLTSNDTADALFVWSSLNLLYVFGISGRLGHDFGDEWDWGGRKDRVLGVGWIPMVRGVQTVVQPIFPTIRSGPLSQLLNLGNWDEIDPDKATDPEDERFCRTRGAWENSSDAPTYEAALWTLRRCRQFMAQFVTTDAEAVKDAGFNRAWQGPFLFFPFAPAEYFTLLHQRQPPALILYAFFGALLHSLNDSWFMEGWGYDIVEVIHDLLGSYWKPWIGWPLDVVGIH